MNWHCDTFISDKVWRYICWTWTHTHTSARTSILISIMAKKKIVHPSCLLFSGKSMIANQEAIFSADSCLSTSLILCLHFESLSIVDGDLIGQFCSLLVVSWQKLEWQFSVLSDIIAVQSVDSWSLISTLSSSCKKNREKEKQQHSLKKARFTHLKSGYSN